MLDVAMCPKVLILTPLDSSRWDISFGADDTYQIRDPFQPGWKWSPMSPVCTMSLCIVADSSRISHTLLYLWNIDRKIMSIGFKIFERLCYVWLRLWMILAYIFLFFSSTAYISRWVGELFSFSQSDCQFLSAIILGILWKFSLSNSPF